MIPVNIKNELKAGIFTYLDVSTCHITQNDMGLLEFYAARQMANIACSFTSCYSYREGIFIHIDDDQEETLIRDEHEFSDDFWTLMDYARELGVAKLRLDADGTIIDGLPKHDW